MLTTTKRKTNSKKKKKNYLKDGAQLYTNWVSCSRVTDLSNQKLQKPHGVDFFFFQ